MGSKVGRAFALTVAVAGLALPAVAAAHVERPSFWPDPAPDVSVSPPAGGAVPVARSLSSAVEKSKGKDKAAADTVRVVCRPNSLELAEDAIDEAYTHGYTLRPTVPKHRISKGWAKKLRQINEKLAERCEYSSIQAAVTNSRNNDRVVIMPGLYTEPASRAVKTPDPACAKYRNDVNGGGAVSYRFHWFCPNDANLIALNGRELGPMTDSLGTGATPPPTDDRHGIPNAGACIRCNVQIEGSGPRPEDVVVEVGDPKAGFGGPSAAGHAKDVGIKIDRADGAVIRNLTVNHAREHDIYVMETDGYLLDRVKLYYAGEYGVLTFGVDHGLTINCDGAGHGDAAVYPGGSPDTGAQRDTSWYPEARLNQEIRDCDLHHSNLGYSGTMGNATHLVDNEIYDNTTGIATESFYAGGHPGYPQDSAVFENNRIYSNNFDDYAPESDVKVRTAVPIGVGLLIGGGNANVVRNNFFYDNWRRAVMLLSVPTEFGCPIEGNNCTPQPDPTNQLSNSFDNRFYDNVLGISPDGEKLPNGVDFWWDQFVGTTGNCFYDNGAYTSDPPPSPVAGQSLPRFLPENCMTSVGTGDIVKESELLACAGVTSFPDCTWSTTPPRPTRTKAAAKFRKRSDRKALRARRRGAGFALAPACLHGIARTGIAELGCRGARGALANAIDAVKANPDIRLQSATCTTWKQADRVLREQIVAALAVAATAPDPESFGPTLTPARAGEVFDGACAPASSRDYVLYVIYNRAAAFAR